MLHKEKPQKGGVAGYAKQSVEGHIHLIKASSEEAGLVCETASFEIRVQKNIIQVLGVYKPPNAKLDQTIDILSDQLDIPLRSKKPTIEINDNTKMEELLTSFDLTIMTLPPTRITPTSKRSIDWICTNINTQLIKTSVILSGLSDHTAQLATVRLVGNRPTLTKERKRVFNNQKINSFKTRLVSRLGNYLHNRKCKPSI